MSIFLLGGELRDSADCHLVSETGLRSDVFLI